MRRIIILCLLILIPNALMADVFTPPPTDKSIDFLGYLFGPTIGGIRLGGATNPALLHMFERFNAVILTVGTMIISYIAVISTINTAQEGQVMGRKWSSIWIPLRSVLGMLLIIPAPNSGYSVIQSVVIWCITQGIGAADSIWNGILNDLSYGLSVTQGINRSAAVDINAKNTYEALELIGADLAESLLRSAVCMQTIHKMHYGTAIEPVGGFRTPSRSHVRTYGGYVQEYVSEASPTLNNAAVAEYYGTMRIGVPGKQEFSEVCGKYVVTGVAKRSEWDSNLQLSLQDLQARAKEIYEHKMWAIQLMLQQFKTIANYVVDEIVTPRDANNRVIGIAEDPVQPGGYRNAAITTYREILKFQTKPKRIDSIKDIIRQGKASGWLSAGSFYFVLNQNHHISFFADIANPPVAANIPRCDDAAKCSDYSPDQINILPATLREFLQYGPEISYMGTRLWDAKIYLDHDITTIADQLALHTQEAATKPLHALQTNMLYLLREMMQEQHSDPLIAQGRFGGSIMMLSERSWLDAQNELHVLLNRAEQDRNSINSELLQRIANLQYRGSLAISIYSVVWIVGAILAVYIPMVPYLIFTLGVIGWLLLVIEAIVASPILAISFMLPTQDELGKGMHGLGLLLNILLRPVLMLFGFVLATRLYQAAVKLVNFGMLSNFDALNTQDSLFAWVAILALYATFIIALANKSFSLIYALPDRILRWMGGIPEQSDPSQELQTSKGAMIKTADTVNKISSGIPERGFARLLARSKQLSPPDAVST